MEEMNPVELAQSISDYGILIVIAAVYLAVTGFMLFYFLKWFVQLIDGMIGKQQVLILEMIDLQRKLFSMINDIKESIQDELLSQVRVVSTYAFDNSKHEAIGHIRRILKENNLKNKSVVEDKIMIILRNLHNNRTSRLDNFSYNGKRLSYYMSTTWILKVFKVMCQELYAEDGFNSGRAAVSIELAYEEIKTEFNKSLMTGLRIDKE